ncbi:hypothetical protein CCHR01_10827 [Colletotrichum chrysophilum]|uniref:Uncharacterized protein n=1 Tax=Colletotrichum chrysophilum TaxID=1836956 RepID=A0AAD9AJA5_9PEZI|nr:hypothetical protein CCHR01_10827 [Colletotrichum chrysophilum]
MGLQHDGSGGCFYLSPRSQLSARYLSLGQPGHRESTFLRTLWYSASERRVASMSMSFPGPRPCIRSISIASSGREGATDRGAASSGLGTCPSWPALPR